MLDNLNPLLGQFRPMGMMSFAGDGDGAGEGGNDGDSGDGGDGGSGAASGAGDKTGQGDWKTVLPNEIREHPSIQKFKTPEGLSKSYLELEKMLGKDKVAIPGDKATPEELDSFYSKLGRPATPEDYKFPEEIEGIGNVKELAESVTMKEFAKAAHKLGMSNKQAEQLFSWYAQQQVSEIKQMNEKAIEERGKADVELRKKWGKNYESNVALAKRVVDTYGNDDTRAMLNEGMGNHPGVVEFFANIGKHISEDSFVPSKGSGLLPSPTQAKAEIDAIRGNKSGPYYDKLHPEHAAMVKRMEALHEIAYPAEKEE